MSGERLSAALYGGGRLCENVARILEGRPSIELLGVFGRAERERALRSGADVVLVATTSFLGAVADDIRAAVEAGSNVITSAEEAAFPWAADERLASELDALARARGVTILGGGLNPGFSFDALVLTACGATWDVERIRVERVVWLAGFSHTILRRLGIGYDAQEFAAGAAAGTISGHIGFPQSMRIVADKLGVAHRADRAGDLADADAGGDRARPPLGPGRYERRLRAALHGRRRRRAVVRGALRRPRRPRRDRRERAGRDRIEAAAPVHLVLDPGLASQTGSAAVVATRCGASPPRLGLAHGCRPAACRPDLARGGHRPPGHDQGSVPWSCPRPAARGRPLVIGPAARSGFVTPWATRAAAAARTASRAETVVPGSNPM